MASVKLYTAIFVALTAITTIQFLLELVLVEAMYGVAFAVILTLSTVKALAVAGWFMHLLDEPRSVTYIALAGVLAVLALTAGATYSIV